MAKVLRCDACQEIYSPHDGKFYGTQELHDGDIVLNLAPTRLMVHQDEVRRVVDSFPIDLCRPCLFRHAQKIFAAEQGGSDG